MSRLKFALITLAAAAIPALASAGGQYQDGRYDGRRYDDGRHSGSTVRCESQAERTRRCRVDTRGGVRLIRQESRSPCIQGRTWGWDGRGIWVTAGCRGRFEVGGGYARGPRDNWGRPDYDRRADIIRCESIDDRPRFCRVPGGLRQAEIVRRLSDSRCDFNRTWGYRRDGVWVERGCRAEFRVY